MNSKTYENDKFSYETVKNRRKYTSIHYHNDYELYYLISGKTKYFIGDEIFLAESGNIIIIPPKMYHMTDSEDCMNNERILISFEKNDVENEISDTLDLLCSKKVIYIPKAKLGIVENIFDKIKNEYKINDQSSKFLINLYINELLAVISRIHLDYNPHLNDEDEIIHNISKYISINYSSNLSLSLLGEKFAMSECYLSRKFKKVAGIGINEYITYVRMMNAEKLLKTTRLPITEISEKCGFNDSNYFSTVFKKVKGITPLKYANKFNK